MQNFDVKPTLEKIWTKLVIATFTDIEIVVSKYFTSAYNVDNFSPKANKICHNIH